MLPRTAPNATFLKATATTLLLMGLFCPETGGLHAADPTSSDPVWIYRDEPRSGRDERPETERLFSPFGIMPRERSTQVAVQTACARDPKDPGNGTCVEVAIRFSEPTDWAGTYWLKAGGAAWGSEPGLNVEDLLEAAPNDEIALRFLAWGTGTVTFKSGGVNQGKFPSSLPFPVSAADSPTVLTGTPTEITIGPIPARRLTNVIDPLCVVASGLDQAADPEQGVRSVTAYVDDLRFEPFERPKTAADWRHKLTDTLWVSYTPTGFDPSRSPPVPPTSESIRADLAALDALRESAGLPRGGLGIVTYGADNGLERVAEAARDAGMPQQLGIFSPTNETEVANARRLLGDASLASTIVGVVVGNEALTFRRGNLDDIKRVIRELKAVRDIPCTSTEIVQEMGNSRLRDACDYLSVNAHAVFSGVHDPEAGAAWVERQVSALLEVSGDKPLLVKEVGHPDGPPPFSPSAQSRYWTALLGSPVVNRANFGVFDGFRNTPWKHEELTVGGEKLDIGNAWGVLLDEERRPLPFAEELLKRWKASRTVP